MSYVYQWFGVVTGAAFLHGCMVGLFSPVTWAPVSRTRSPVSPQGAAERERWR